jgi:hypothetical protein
VIGWPTREKMYEHYSEVDRQGNATNTLTGICAVATATTWDWFVFVSLEALEVAFA